jgi:hypothetical protein
MSSTRSDRGRCVRPSTLLEHWSVQQPDARVPAGGAEATKSQKEGLCRLGPRVPTASIAWATTLPETVLVHTTEGPSGDAEVDVSFQPAIFMLASAFATTVAAERALVNW